MPSLPQLGGVASACKRCLRRLGWRQGRLPPGGSPAHDLVGEQNAAHLRVLVLAFINDGLRGGQAEAGVTKSLRLGRQTTTGTAGLAGGRCTAPPRGDNQPNRPPSHPTTPGAGPGLRGLSPPACRALPTGARRAWAPEGCGKGEAGPAKTRAQPARARGLPPGLGHRSLAESSGHCLH